MPRVSSAMLSRYVGKNQSRGLDGRDRADLAGLLAVGGGVGREAALLGERGHLHVEPARDDHAAVELEERVDVGQVEPAGGCAVHGMAGVVEQPDRLARSGGHGRCGARR